MTRRSLLRYGLAGATVISGRFSLGQPRAAPSTMPPFQASLPRLPVLNPTTQDATTDYYQMTLAPSQVEIIPGFPTTVWAFNGSYPGPTILAQAGRTVRITQTNQLDIQTSVHL